MIDRYERTLTGVEIEAALASLLAAIEAEEERNPQGQKASAGAIPYVSDADLTKTDPAVWKVERLIADPIGRACREQIKALGELLFLVTGSTDEMCDTLDRVAGLNPDRSGERAELINTWWSVYGEECDVPRL